MIHSSSQIFQRGKTIFQVEHLDPLVNQLCRVCDEPAAGFHFGAFTCEGCKSFFGRTCNNQSVISECKNQYRCVVDKKNRTSCKACRLRKCLMVGMSKSGSRYGRRSNWFKIHCLMQQKTGHSTSNTDPAPSLASQLKTEASAVSRSPSPQSANTSHESLSKKSSLSSPQSEADSGLGTSPPLASLYPSPLSLLSPASPMLPFYKLSPLLAAHSPLLANPLLLSLAQAGHHHQAPVSRSHLELLSEHRELLARFGAARSALASLPTSSPIPEAEDRPVSPPSVSDSPMDLRMRLSATAFLTPTLGAPSSPSSSSPDDEGIEVDIGDKSDTARDVRSREAPGAVLDLTVSS